MKLRSSQKKVVLLEGGQDRVPEFAGIRAGWGVDFPKPDHLEWRIPPLNPRAGILECAVGKGLDRRILFLERCHGDPKGLKLIFVLQVAYLRLAFNV
jgi:hypothetical protein